MRNTLFDLFSGASSGVNTITDTFPPDAIDRYKVGENYALVSGSDGWPRTGSLRAVMAENGSIFQELLYKEFNKTGILRRVYTPPEDQVTYNSYDGTSSIPDGRYANCQGNSYVNITFFDDETGKYFRIDGFCNGNPILDETFTLTNFPWARIHAMHPELNKSYTISYSINAFSIRVGDIVDPILQGNQGFAYIDDAVFSMKIGSNAVVDSLFKYYDITVLDGAISLSTGMETFFNVSQMTNHDHYSAKIKVSYDASLLGETDIWNAYFQFKVEETNNETFETYIFGLKDAPIAAIWFPGVNTESTPDALTPGDLYIRIFRSNGVIAIEYSYDDITWTMMYQQRFYTSESIKELTFNTDGDQAFQDSVSFLGLTLENGRPSDSAWSDWQEILDGEVKIDLSSLVYPNDYGSIQTLNEAFMKLNKEFEVRTMRNIAHNFDKYISCYSTNGLFYDSYISNLIWVGGGAELAGSYDITTAFSPSWQHAKTVYHRSFLALDMVGYSYYIKSEFKLKSKVPGEKVLGMINVIQETDFTDDSEISNFPLRHIGYLPGYVTTIYDHIDDSSFSSFSRLVQGGWDQPVIFLNASIYSDEKYGFFDSNNNRMKVWFGKENIRGISCTGGNILNPNTDTTFYWSVTGNTFSAFSDEQRTVLLGTANITTNIGSSVYGVIFWNATGASCVWYYDNTIDLDGMSGHYRYLPVEILDYNITVEKKVG